MLRLTRSGHVALIRPPLLLDAAECLFCVREGRFSLCSLEEATTRSAEIVRTQLELAKKSVQRAPIAQMGSSTCVPRGVSAVLLGNRCPPARIGVHPDTIVLPVHRFLYLAQKAFTLLVRHGNAPLVRGRVRRPCSARIAENVASAAPSAWHPDQHDVPCRALDAIAKQAR